MYWKYDKCMGLNTESYLGSSQKSKKKKILTCLHTQFWGLRISPDSAKHVFRLCDQFLLPELRAEVHMRTDFLWLENHEPFI